MKFFNNNNNNNNNAQNIIIDMKNIRKNDRSIGKLTESLEKDITREKNIYMKLHDSTRNSLKRLRKIKRYLDCVWDKLILGSFFYHLAYFWYYS